MDKAELFREPVRTLSGLESTIRWLRLGAASQRDVHAARPGADRTTSVLVDTSDWVVHFRLRSEALRRFARPGSSDDASD